MPPLVVCFAGVVADEGHAEGKGGGGFADVMAFGYVGRVVCEAHAGVEGACTFGFGDVADVFDGVVGVDEVPVVGVDGFDAVSVAAIAAVAARLAEAEDAGCCWRRFLCYVGCSWGADGRFIWGWWSAGIERVFGAEGC